MAVVQTPVRPTLNGPRIFHCNNIKRLCPIDLAFRKSRELLLGTTYTNQGGALLPTRRHLYLSGEEACRGFPPGFHTSPRAKTVRAKGRSYMMARAMLGCDRDGFRQAALSTSFSAWQAGRGYFRPRSGFRSCPKHVLMLCRSIEHIPAADEMPSAQMQRHCRKLCSGR